MTQNKLINPSESAVQLVAALITAGHLGPDAQQIAAKHRELVEALDPPAESWVEGLTDQDANVFSAG